MLCIVAYLKDRQPSSHSLISSSKRGLTKEEFYQSFRNTQNIIVLVFSRYPCYEYETIEMLVSYPLLSAEA